MSVGQSKPVDRQRRSFAFALRTETLTRTETYRLAMNTTFKGGFKDLWGMYWIPFLRTSESRQPSQALNTSPLYTRGPPTTSYNCSPSYQQQSSRATTKSLLHHFKRVETSNIHRGTPAMARLQDEVVESCAEISDTSTLWHARIRRPRADNLGVSQSIERAIYAGSRI